MNLLDNYGEFELPEEKSKIEVVEDPVKTVMSCYEMFKELLNSKRRAEKSVNIVSMREEYDFATKVFKEKEKLKPAPKEIEQILKNLENARWENYPDVFLTTLLNTTDLETLILKNPCPKIRDMGHKLKPNKKLIMGREIYVFNAGDEKQGHIINYGLISNGVGWKSKSGLVINYGHIDNIFNFSQDVHINHNRIQCTCFTDSSKEFTYINQGLSTEVRYPCRTQIIQGEIIYKRNIFSSKQLKNPALKQKLDGKLSEIKFLETLPELSYEEQCKKAEEFDFNKFEKEISEIVEEMYEAEGAGK